MYGYQIGLSYSNLNLDYFLSNIECPFFQHHCRKCGAVVCGACSTRRYLLPSQSSKPIRVCDPCYEQLTETKTSNAPSSSNANNVNTGTLFGNFNSNYFSNMWSLC